MNAREEKANRVLQDAFHHEQAKVKNLEAELIHNEGCYVDAIGEYRLEEQDLRKKVAKLEGWLRYLWGGGYPIDDIDTEIDSYIKELEAKE
jgi:hypothetical protein